jgi:hypothetical protein
VKTLTAIRNLAVAGAAFAGFSLGLPGSAYGYDAQPTSPERASYAVGSAESRRTDDRREETPQPLGAQICETPSEQLNFCGRVINLSGTPIIAYMDRCGSGATPCQHSHQRRLLRGDSTPGYEDWDLARVPCRSFGYKNILGGANIPWSGGSGYHIVRDSETLTIVSTTC